MEVGITLNKNPKNLWTGLCACLPATYAKTPGVLRAAAIAPHEKAAVQVSSRLTLSSRGIKAKHCDNKGCPAARGLKVSIQLPCLINAVTTVAPSQEHISFTHTNKKSGKLPCKLPPHRVQMSPVCFYIMDMQQISSGISL